MKNQTKDRTSINDFYDKAFIEGEKQGKAQAIQQISDWIEVNKWWTNQGSLVISYTSLIDKMEKLK